MEKRRFWLFLPVAVLAAELAVGEGNPVAKIGPSGDSVDVIQQRDGRAVTNSLPLYRSGNVRYFSAGVGVVERAAEYPVYSLKIVVTAGGKPYLSGVAVTIQPSKGASITIPRDQVEGPWLFVDLSPGQYDVSANNGDQVRHLKGVKIEAGKQKVVYLRWKEDAGIARAAAE